MILTARSVNNATQFSGSAMVQVPYRWQEKVVETEERHQRRRNRNQSCVDTVATINTTSRNVSATMVGFVTRSQAE